MHVCVTVENLDPTKVRQTTVYHIIRWDEVICYARRTNQKRREATVFCAEGKKKVKEEFCTKGKEQCN